MTIRLLLSALCITACSGDVAPSSASRGARDLTPTVERDSAGVTIVENGAPVWDSTTAWRVTPQPLLSIGSVDGGEKAANFAWVRDAKRLSDGRIVVMANQGHEIRWFGPDGRHLFTRGGRGKGPGEFTSASALLRLPGDTIVVQNMPLIKHVFFGPDGSLVREEPLDYKHGLDRRGR